MIATSRILADPIGFAQLVGWVAGGFLVLAALGEVVDALARWRRRNEARIHDEVRRVASRPPRRARP